LPLRLLANENIPAAAVEALRREGHDVVWAADGVSSTTDSDILQIAHAENRTVLTFDKDFGELAFRAKLPVSGGVVLFRIASSNAAVAAQIIAAAVRSRTDWAGHFSVVENDRVRMTPLPGVETA
jgi:predicted nuclease of predicted toxin-antitoxin system